MITIVRFFAKRVEVIALPRRQEQMRWQIGWPKAIANRMVESVWTGL
jgi:hypothetical protein